MKGTLAQSMLQSTATWCCAGLALLFGGLAAAYMLMRWWADRKDR